MATQKTPTKKTKRKTKQQKVDDFLSSVKPAPEYVKHLVECRCFLPQYKSWEVPPNHKFVVFSELEEEGGLKSSYVQCNNCGIIHRVLEVGSSVTIKKEEMRSLTTTADLEGQMPLWLVTMLKSHNCDLHVWQEAKFIVDHSLWGRFIVLAKDREDDMILGKLCQILGNNLHKIESFELDEGWIEP